MPNAEPSEVATGANFTVVVNWRDRGFGCAKTCSYCTWRDSPYLPHGAQSKESIVNFISKCKKTFVTVSGGADPLYQFDKYGDQLVAMISTIREQGFKVRIITREIKHVAKLKGLVDCVSISLDPEVMCQLPDYVSLWDGVDVECSLVFPPLPNDEIVRLKHQYISLFRQLSGMGDVANWCQRLVLRENLNSIFPIDLKSVSFGFSGIVFVPRSLCLNGRYLSQICSTGHALIQDNAVLANYLMGQQDIILFGGFVKHVIQPVLHDYVDIDVIALDFTVLQRIETLFEYRFKEISDSSSYPRYFVGRSSKAGKTIQVILLQSMRDALQFVHRAQFDVDRVALCNHQFYFDEEIGEAVIRQAITTKVVHRVSCDKRFWLFHSDRSQIEKKHQMKLLKKGFRIVE